MLDDGQYRIVDGAITDGGVNENQIEWYKWAVNGINKTSGKNVPNMAFMHVPVPEYKELNDNFEMGLRQEDSCTARDNDGFFEAFQQMAVHICLQVTTITTILLPIITELNFAI